MKKEVIALLLIFLFGLLLINLVFALGDGDEPEAGEDKGLQESEEIPEEWETNDEDQVVVPEDQDYEITDISETTQIQQSTNGPIADFSLQNSLFSAGNFIQGTLFSFTNANPLNFQSMFDSSLFTLTLNDQDQAEIAQTNGFGELGYTYISTSGGNLTQDGVVIFIPDGDSPTYIYYNTTEVIFEDGNVYLGTESLTNTDETKEPSSLNFDQNGFTKVQIQPHNNYTQGDYTFINNEEEPIWACKDDFSCQIDIDTEENIYYIKGKITVYKNDYTIIESFDTNNEITFYYEERSIDFYNSQPSQEPLLIVYNGHHRITETQENIYDLPISDRYAEIITTYTSTLNSKTLTFEKETLIFNFFKLFIPTSAGETDCFEQENDYC